MIFHEINFRYSKYNIVIFTCNYELIDINQRRM